MWRADLALVFVCLVWGATFIVVKNAVLDIPVLLFLTIRFSIAALVLALIFGFRKDRPPLRASLLGGIVAGFFLFSGYALQTHGLAQTTAAKTGFITGLYIPLVPILSALVYRKVPQIAELIGVCLAFTGTALMTIQKDIFSINRGDLLVASSGAILEDGRCRLAGRHTDRNCSGTRLAHVWRDATCWRRALDDRRLVCPRRHKSSVYRIRVLGPDVGAEIYFCYAHGADLLAGAALRVAGGVYRCGRGTHRPQHRRRRAHPRRCFLRRIETIGLRRCGCR